MLSKQITPQCSDKICTFLSRTYQLFIIHGRAKTRGNISVSYEPFPPLGNIGSDDCQHYEIPSEDHSNYNLVAATAFRFVVTKDSVEKAFSKYGSHKCTHKFPPNKYDTFYTPFASLQLIIEQFSYDGYTFHEDLMMPCT